MEKRKWASFEDVSLNFWQPYTLKLYKDDIVLPSLVNECDGDILRPADHSYLMFIRGRHILHRDSCFQQAQVIYKPFFYEPSCTKDVKIRFPFFNKFCYSLPYTCRHTVVTNLFSAELWKTFASHLRDLKFVYIIYIPQFHNLLNNNIHIPATSDQYSHGNVETETRSSVLCCM
jgi:hypothetical protein